MIKSDFSDRVLVRMRKCQMMKLSANKKSFPLANNNSDILISLKYKTIEFSVPDKAALILEVYHSDM